MMEWLKRHLISVVLVAGVVLLGVAIVQRVIETSGSGEQARRGGGASPVVVAEVIRAPFLDTLQAVGSARALESVEVTASVSDRVRAIGFREGEVAEAGDVLVELDTTEEVAELDEALANLDDQRRQFERLDALVTTNAAAKSQRDEQRARMQAAAARVQIIRARIDDRFIVAPFTGLVGLREVSPGALVAPGTRITTLDAIEPIRLDFSIPENFLSTLQPGATIRARTVAYPGRVFVGRVAHISPRVDPISRAVAIRAELPNTDRRLRPGMLMTVDLVRDRRSSLMIPESALIPQGDRQYLFRVVDGRAERVEVRIRARRPGIVEITDGLELGDMVVIEGGIRLRPGAEVSVQREVDSTSLIAAEDREAFESPVDGAPAAAAEGGEPGR